MLHMHYLNESWPQACKQVKLWVSPHAVTKIPHAATKIKAPTCRKLRPSCIQMTFKVIVIPFATESETQRSECLPKATEPGNADGAIAISPNLVCLPHFLPQLLLHTIVCGWEHRPGAALSSSPSGLKETVPSSGPQRWGWVHQFWLWKIVCVSVLISETADASKTTTKIFKRIGEVELTKICSWLIKHGSEKGRVWSNVYVLAVATGWLGMPVTELGTWRCWWKPIKKAGE